MWRGFPVGFAQWLVRTVGGLVVPVVLCSTRSDCVDWCASPAVVGLGNCAHHGPNHQYVRRRGVVHMVAAVRSLRVHSCLWSVSDVSGCLPLKCNVCLLRGQRFVCFLLVLYRRPLFCPSAMFVCHTRRAGDIPRRYHGHTTATTRQQHCAYARARS